MDISRSELAHEHAPMLSPSLTIRHEAEVPLMAHAGQETLSMVYHFRLELAHSSFSKGKRGLSEYIADLSWKRSAAAFAVFTKIRLRPRICTRTILPKDHIQLARFVTTKKERTIFVTPLGESLPFMFARNIQYIPKKWHGLRTWWKWEVVTFRAFGGLSGSFVATKKLQGDGNSKPGEHDRYRNCSQGVQKVEGHHLQNAHNEKGESLRRGGGEFSSTVMIQVLSYAKLRGRKWRRLRGQIGFQRDMALEVYTDVRFLVCTEVKHDKPAST